MKIGVERDPQGGRAVLSGRLGIGDAMHVKESLSALPDYTPITLDPSNADWIDTSIASAIAVPVLRQSFDVDACGGGHDLDLHILSGMLPCSELAVLLRMTN